MDLDVLTHATARDHLICINDRRMLPSMLLQRTRTMVSDLWATCQIVRWRHVGTTLRDFEKMLKVTPLLPSARVMSMIFQQSALKVT